MTAIFHPPQRKPEGLPARKVCPTCCAILNIGALSRNKGVRLHADLKELRICADTCGLCHAAWEALREGFLNLRSQDTARPWLSREAETDFCARAEYGKWMGSDAVLIIAERFNGAVSHSDEAEGAQLPYWETQWMRLRTEYNDPAVDAGIAWMRTPGTNTSSSASLDLAKSWLQRCLADESGADMQVARAQAPNKRPTRLLEVGLPSSTGQGVQLVKGQDTGEMYAALSYCWGTAAPVWQTTKSNVESRSGEVPFLQSELPNTISEAVTVTVRLGIKYLWVDSLCIIQDDSDDWAREAGRMADVYTNACVTLAADASPGSTHGLFNQKSQGTLDAAGSYSLTSSLEDGRESTLVLWSPQNGPEPSWRRVLNGRLATRGWCCQEQRLSARILHFTDSQLMWECRHGRRSEDNYEDTTASPSLKLPMAQHSITRVLKLWYKIVTTDYSRRFLTHGSDKLIALAGLASYFHSVRPMRYLAGLWEEQLLAGLSWSRRDSHGTKAEEYRAPSWSWASQDSQIAYHLTLTGNVAKEYAQVRHAEITLASENVFGAVTGGHLVLHGPLVNARYSKALVREEVDDEEIQVEEEAPLSSTVKLETGIELYATLDDHRTADEVECVATPLMEGSWRPEQSEVFFILLQPVSDGTSPNLYRRIGLARKVFRPKLREYDRVCMERFEALRCSEFKII